MIKLIKIGLLAACMLASTPAICNKYTHTTNKEIKLTFQNRVEEVIYYTKLHNLDFNWLKVFITESGWNFDSNMALKTNNIMGMNAHNRVTCINTYKGHAVYNSLEDAIKDIKLWEQLNPRRANESFIDFLKRRRYNPYEDYYIYLTKIDVSKYAE